MGRKIWILLAGAGGAVLLAVLGVVLFFSQPVQHWIVARLVDPRPEDEFSIEHARVGLTRTEIRGFVLERPDIGYRAEELVADLSVWDIFFADHVNLAMIEATGLEFDFTRFWDVPRPEDPDPLAGILGELDVPVRLTIQNADVSGRVLLPGAGDEPMTVSVHITGGGVAVGDVGEFALEVLIEDPAAEGWMRELQAEGEIALRQNEAGSFDDLKATATLTRFGMEPPYEEELRVDAHLNREGERETYQAHIHRISEGESPATLLEVNAAFHDEDRVISGEWEFRAERDQLEALMATEGFPDFGGNGKGEFAFNTDTHAIEIQGDLEGTMDELEVVRGELRRAGGFGVASRFVFQRDDEWLRFEELDLTISSLDTGESLLQARANNPIRYHRDRRQIVHEEGESSLLEVRADRAPVEWAGFLPFEELPMLIEGVLVGHVMVNAVEDGFRLETIEAIRLGPVTAILDDEVLFSDAVFDLAGAGSWIDGAGQVEVERFRVVLGDIEALFVEGSFSQREELFEGRVTADLPSLLARPMVGFRDLLRGRLEAEFEGGADRPVEASFLLDGVLLDGAEAALPTVYLDLLAEPAAEGEWEIRAPLRLERPGLETEVTISGKIFAELSPQRFDLQITGDHLVLPDLLGLGDAFSQPEEAPDEEERTPDENPFWEGWEGSVLAEFETIQLGEGYALEGVRLQLETTEERFTAALESHFLGSPLKMNAALGFMTGEDRPYRLGGDLEAPTVDVGGLFHEFQPDRPSTLEGIYAVTGELASEGTDPGDLIRRLGGAVRLRSESGILRLFYVENPLVGIGLGVAGLLGGLGGELGTIIDIANELEEVPYDLVEVVLERDEGLNLRLHGLQVIAPELHLQGVGFLEHQEDIDFLNQPMELRLELGARGELEELLGRAGALGEARDELGYRRMLTPFTIEGELADPDVTPFFGVIAGAILELTAPIPGRAGREEERALPPRDPEFGEEPPEDDEERPDE